MNDTAPTPIRVLAYAKSASMDAAQRQLELIREYCEQQGYELAAEIIDTEGVVSWNPADWAGIAEPFGMFQVEPELAERISSADRIVVTEVHRITRDLHSFAKFEHRLAVAGKTLETTDGLTIPTGHEDRVAAIMKATAKLYTDQARAAVRLFEDTVTRREISAATARLGDNPLPDSEAAQQQRDVDDACEYVLHRCGLDVEEHQDPADEARRHLAAIESVIAGTSPDLKTSSETIEQVDATLSRMTQLVKQHREEIVSLAEEVYRS